MTITLTPEEIELMREGAQKMWDEYDAPAMSTPPQDQYKEECISKVRAAESVLKKLEGK